MTYKIGIVGVGKIARDQHIPVINNHKDFELVATVSTSGGYPGAKNYTDIQTMIDQEPCLDAIALCMPPAFRFKAALVALANNKHILLEKPPGATLVEVEHIKNIAKEKGLTAYAAWHSRHAAAVESCKALLATALIESVDIQWREDVRQWHPDQEWIWQAGGMGVFDPGINALSIASDILPWDFPLLTAQLSFPSNKCTPIAALLTFCSPDNIPVQANLDWREETLQVWEITIETNLGEIKLIEGGARLYINGEEQVIPQVPEYQNVYNYFSNLLNSSRSDIDMRPSQYVADAFVLGERSVVDAFL